MQSGNVPSQPIDLSDQIGDSSEAAGSASSLLDPIDAPQSFFLLNGMGRLTVESIFRREYPTVQYAVVVLALIYVTVNFLIDLAYAWIDPRVRVGRALG